MTIRIWITRTEPGATRSAEAWAAAGFEPVVAPLLTVHPVAQPDLVPDQAELIFTSAHGVRHCGIIGDGRQVYAVGDATAAIAREHGFQQVVSASGDWRSLVEVIEKKQNTIIHVSGTTVRGAIVQTLRERGLQARRQIVYDTQAVTQWPLQSEKVTAVALYSQMASSALMALPSRDLSGMTAYCLSPNVAAPLRGLRACIADDPTEAALIACSRPAEA